MAAQNGSDGEITASCSIEGSEMFATTVKAEGKDADDFIYLLLKMREGIESHRAAFDRRCCAATIATAAAVPSAAA